MKSEGVFIMRKLGKYLFMWGLGGCIYYSFEVLFRGFSHWSMFVLGGSCFLFIIRQGELVHWSEPLWRQMFRSVVFVTSMEFVTGIIVNKWLHLAVWDYTDQPFQLFGQICLPFMIIFSGLCTIGILFGGYLECLLFGAEKPEFHVL